MKRILVATVKPFAPAAVEQIKAVVDEAGYSFNLLEKYGDQSDLVNGVKGMDAIIVRSDKVTDEVIQAADQLKIHTSRSRIR